MTEENIKTSIEMTQPIIIDLGKQKNRALKNLKKGKGQLWDEVLDVVEEVKDTLGAEADGKILIPIVVLYREKPKQKRRNLERILSTLLG
jgi:hypothetical protein